MKIVLILALSFYLIASIFTFTVDSDYFEKYNGYTVYKVFPTTDDQIEFLRELPEQYLDISLWTEASRKNVAVDVMVSAARKETFLVLLRKLKIKSEIKIENVANLMAKHQPLFGQDLLDASFNYSRYHTLDEINAWIDDTSNNNPNLVSVVNIGQSYENRAIRALKLSAPSSSPKKAIWVDGGIHAREWISPATVICYTNALVTQYPNNSDVKAILDTFDIYVLPVFNVDGYVYTWTSDRLWRKTRRPTRLAICKGADPNRNWNSHFCEPGASKNPCSETYCGDSAFSEPETKAVSDFLLQNKGTFISYTNVHSYSQLWMSPYGYGTNKPVDYNVQDAGSAIAVAALEKRYGTKYQHGNIASTIYVASGNTADWAYDTAAIKFSYAIELRDLGEYGFLLPEDQIQPTCLETTDAFNALFLYIKSQL